MSSARRVVVTGIGVVSPIGNSISEAMDAFRSDRHGFCAMPEWAKVARLDSRVAAKADDFDFQSLYPRKLRRSMGRVALLSCIATDWAVADAGLSAEDLASLRLGLAYGSTAGSSSDQEVWYDKIFSNKGFVGVGATDYLRFMSHTCAANLAIKHGVRGRVIPTCSACVSGSQAIGFGFEAIRAGSTDTMICGGAEELHFSHAGIFDVLYAASTVYNDMPGEASRPFDTKRDGLVVGEGAGTFVLQERSLAIEQGKTIYGEILGFGTTCDGKHMTAPTPEGMSSAMEQALLSAELPADRIDYINAHATATEVGDIAESHATHAVFGSDTPISSTKSFTGHTLGACGAIESAFCIGMMDEGWFAPTRTLHEVDPRCADLDYIRGQGRSIDASIVMNNNFAFGGLNTSLILAKHSQ